MQTLRSIFQCIRTLYYEINRFYSLCFFSQHVLADCNEYSESGTSSQVIEHYTINNKSFFYFSPNEKNKSEPLFLIKGNDFNGYLKNGSYTFGNYIRKNGSVVNGWLKTQTLNQNPSEQKRPALKLYKSVEQRYL